MNILSFSARKQIVFLKLLLRMHRLLQRIFHSARDVHLRIRRRRKHVHVTLTSLAQRSKIIN